MIKDIHVSNFRSFADFQMSGLANVNLIAGKNNVGKSTLLDALYLLLTQEDFLAFCKLIQHRKEVGSTFFNDVDQERDYQVNHLFSGHRLKNGDKIAISANQGNQQYNLAYAETHNSPDPYHHSDRYDGPNFSSRLEIDYGHNLHRIPLDIYGQLSIKYIRQSNMRLRFSDAKNRSSYITTQGLDMGILSQMWDKIGLAPERDYVLRMLNILDPNLSEIQFLTSGEGIRVRHKLFDMPIPLGSMGDGMNRVLGIAMSMATLQNGYLIIDEIDTGLHYRTITDMWKLVITAAKELNVQVFATTHSQDCIISFSEAMQELEDDESGAYFRLQRRGEKIQAVRYGADKLATALNSRGEVR